MEFKKEKEDQIQENFLEEETENENENENEEDDPASISAVFEMLAYMIDSILDFFNVNSKK